MTLAARSASALSLIAALGTVAPEGPVSLVHPLDGHAGVCWEGFKGCSWGQDFESAPIHLGTFKCMSAGTRGHERPKESNEQDR